ncbi:thiamine phosphate synthase [Metabacillus bambusae]|nr:thiamine phosphate synthase [Metabacillus bambusae]
MKIGDALKVYFVMGSTNCRDLDPEKTLYEALEGGVTLFQFREKGVGCLVGHECIYLGNSLRKLCKQYKVPFIVNDDIELAIELGADGVHIGQDDRDPLLTRKQIGHDKWLGISTHSVEEAKQAVKDGANYIGVGPMYSTKTKADAHAVVGPELITQIRTSGLSDFPIVGIGGITLENATNVYKAGANGVAIISGISQAKSPEQAAAAFRKIGEDSKSKSLQDFCSKLQKSSQ